MIDFQTYISNQLKAERGKRFANSNQMTLGELIREFQSLVNSPDFKEREEEPVVVYDFGNLFPYRLDSWRGSYDELALSYVGRDGYNPLTATKFLNMLVSAVGKTFTGYKGGDFVMSRQTPIWVSNYGDSSNTAVIDVVNNGYSIILITGLSEF